MYTYIVVDDETIIRQGLIKKIKKLEMELECAGQASNGIEGLRLIEQADPDIIITDMKMPEMDGTRFLDSISENYPDKKVIVLSSYKDYEYMNTAIETGVIGYVLKPFSADEIQKQLKKAVDRIERQQNMKAQVGTMKEHIGMIERRMDNQKLLNYIIHPVEKSTLSQADAEKFEKVRRFQLIMIHTANPSLLTQLEDMCNTEDHSLKAVPLEDVSKEFRYFILLMNDTGQEQHLEGHANELAGRLKAKNTHYIQYICLSNICKDITEVNGLYKSCVDNMMGVNISDRQCIVTPYKREAKRVHTDEDIKDVFISMRYTPDAIHDLIDSFFSRIEVKNPTFEVLYTECGYLIELVNEFALQYGIETEDIMSVFIDRYILEKDMSRIRRETSGYITLIFNSVKNSSQSQERLMENIKQYIDKNYGSKITLESISSKFFISPTYCSYLFKLKTQESFNDYTTRIRMEKAVKFLAETGMSIDNISKEVGYRNPKYFFKIFKKYMGLTPTQYRKRKQR